MLISPIWNYQYIPSYLVSHHVFANGILEYDSPYPFYRLPASCYDPRKWGPKSSILPSFQRGKTSFSTILEISLKTIGCASRKWQLTGLEDLTQIKGREIFPCTTCPRNLLVPLGPPFFPASFYKLGESPLTKVPTRVFRPKHLPNYTVEEGIKTGRRKGVKTEGK